MRTTMVDEVGRRAAEWLDRTYAGLVRLADDEPVVAGERTWLFGCEYADAVDEPMLASAIVVPMDGAEPFPPANSDPLDEPYNMSRPLDLGRRPWAWRANARNCLVATDAGLDQRPATALPWQPRDEAPGWWPRLLAEYFPDAEVAVCTSWSEVADAILDAGPDTRGAVWLRRRLHGVELTGHLVNVLNDEGQAVFLDGQRGSLAKLEEDVSGLVLARFHRPAPMETIAVPWQAGAADLASALAKARSWLDQAYSDDVVLVAPGPADETRRGWLFACTTARFLGSGHWQDQMLDAALVVPKAAGEEPFGLPNSDPWDYLAKWDAGESGLAAPPAPGAAAWFGPMAQQLGRVVSTNVHQHWGEVLSELATLSQDARAVVWVRRRDARGRETLGNLLMADAASDGVRLVDAMAEDGNPTLDQEVLNLHVIRFE
ncbi:YrhB domain-containing protein [Saccharopolyspora erythraea]|nr:YrhB domain-containing protein [Saccharopolyspora erythraea]